ncbi:hypothetical protein ACFYPG_06045 [Micromonospora sp. NPDC005553]|uniref:hypothetical protein n=1 Tax=unclassified Micromonospora TaxID=2617518 RepID=UPI0033A50892
MRDRGFTRAYVDAVVAGHWLDHERQETERVIARLLIAANHGVVLATGPDVAADSQRFLSLALRSLQP